MRVSRPVWASTHVGRVRQVNEDRCLVGEWRSDGSAVNWQGAIDISCGWAVIADGMGGHGAGDVASRVALGTIAGEIRDVIGETGIEQMLDFANRDLHEAMYSNDGIPGMGTTIVGVVLSGSEALIFNVGDSRAYSMGRDGLVQMSEDDTVGGSTRRGRARSHALTECLGGTVHRRPLQPHIRRRQLAGSIGLLLCSDGLADMLSDGEIADILVQNATNPAEQLVAAALNAGGRDNVTVVVVGTEKVQGTA